MVFIKSVSLNCFRSYRDQAGKQNFSDKTNAIVGLNGKGKSNFFYAIRFVCDMFDNLPSEQRFGFLFFVCFFVLFCFVFSLSFFLFFFFFFFFFFLNF